MHFKQLKLCAGFLLIIVSTTMLAQESINTAGSNATGNGGTVSYTIGQISYNTDLGTNGSVSQGVQQAFEIFDLSTEELTETNFSAVIYPNPTTEYLTIEVKNLEFSLLNIQIFDSLGRVLQNKNTKDQKIVLDMKNLPSSTYYIKIELDNKILKSYKIIKK